MSCWYPIPRDSTAVGVDESSRYLRRSIAVSVKVKMLPTSVTPHFSNDLDKGESGFVQKILSMTNSKSVVDVMLRVRIH